MREMRKIRGQSGIAMVTVLFVASALTVIGSTATFVTIHELRSSTDDRRASEALAYAEAGADRLLLELKRGSITWGHIKEAGCKYPPLVLPTTSIGNGTYDASLTVYDPEAPADQRVPATPWTSANDAAVPCLNRTGSPRANEWFAISVKGSHPTATRVVRQVVRIGSVNLPVGIYADTVTANGNPDLNGISLITPGDIVGREKIGFTGNDVYYTMADFWPGMSDTMPVPTSAHAVGAIYYKKFGGKKQVHPPSPNCDANDARGTQGQSMFDGSVSGKPITTSCPTWGGVQPAPTTSLFTPEDLQRVVSRTSLTDQDYLTLKEAAKTSGLYCYFPVSSSASCTKKGATISPNTTITNAMIDGLANHFVTYLEYQDPTKAMSGNLIMWQADWWGCNEDPFLDKSVVIVVRNGSMKFASGRMVNGALFLPEGSFNDTGGHTFNGTIIAKKFDSTGNPQKQLNTCWLNNMPGPFLDVTTSRWSELDRTS